MQKLWIFYHVTVCEKSFWIIESCKMCKRGTIFLSKLKLQSHELENEWNCGDDGKNGCEVCVESCGRFQLSFQTIYSKSCTFIF